MDRPDQTPVFIDLETRSACDLRKEGSTRYAAHPTTQILTAAWTDDGGENYHLWLPGAVDGIPELQIAAQKLEGVIVHTDASVPEDLLSVTHRPWAGHNTWGFDRLVWAKLAPPEAQPTVWFDTMPLAASIGLPQGLDAIGKRLSGDNEDGGKEKAGKSMLKKHSRCNGPHYPVSKKGVKSKVLVDDSSIVNVPIVAQLMIGRYNIKDVQISVDLWELLSSEVNMNNAERRVLRVHDSCNQRGVKIDGDFVRALEELSTSSAAHAFKTIEELTAGDENKLNAKNLNSRPTVLAWLAEKGVNLGQSLAKGIIAKFIDNNSTEDEDPDASESAEEDDSDTSSGRNPNLPVVLQVLTLRMAALRVTSGKIAAARSRMGEDGKIRHWSSYWAAHTGRWAGRGIQPHNFPRPKEGVDVWDLCSLYDESGKTLTYESVLARMPIKALDATGKPLYPRLSVDDAASGLLRSMIVPDDVPGHVIMAADLANIEARVLAWLAGEEWLMKAFWSGADPYLKMAEKIFGAMNTWKQFPDPKKKGEFLPIKKHPFRQVGKVVVLGCIGEGTPVLTLRGWVRIESVQADDLLWDGSSWVSHGGVVCTGEKKCVKVNNVWMTPDHRVWTDAGWVAAEDLPDSGPSLSGAYWARGKFKPLREAPEERLSTHSPSALVGGSECPRPATSSQGDRQGATRARSEKQQSLKPCTPRSARTPLTGRDCSTGSAPSLADARTVNTESSPITEVVVYLSPLSGLRIGESFYGTYSPSTDGTDLSSKLTERITVEATSLAIYASRHGPSSATTVVRTYDILNVGTRSAFQAGGLLVHNCGYQLGVDQFAVYAAANQIDLASVGATAPGCIYAFRRMHPAIAGPEAGEFEGKPFFKGGLWCQLNAAAVAACCGTPSSVGAGKVRFEREGPHLVVTLPSGRRLVYRDAQVVMKDYFGKPKETVTYLSPRFGRKALYGGSLAENIVQAISRDILAYGFVLCEDDGIPIVLHVHDELVSSGLEERFPDFMSHVTTCPQWLPDFPLDAEGCCAPRYAKAAPPGVKEIVYRNGEVKT